ncbi:MAG: hydrogenase small subunit [Desulfobulbaceae bacterium]|nr:hydrogenase small subunit [Desulfobulbaceae bacterium]
MNRRQFIKMAAALGAVFGLQGVPDTVVAALKKITPADIPKIIYLQGLSCTGCSISLLQATSPSPLSLITDYSQLAFHADLSATSGKQAINMIDDYISGNAGEYFLALEGAVPENMPDACKIGHTFYGDYIKKGAKTAAGIITVGSCASFGGIPAAEGNQTGAVSVPTYLKNNNLSPLLITIPGCPVHPDWLWHTITHLVKIGLPELNKYQSPKLFFGKNLHEACPRYHYFQEEIFAKKLGDNGCLFKVGCLGPETFADCPTRWWNGGQTWCIDTNAPCIGCASPNFALNKNFPIYRIS